MRSPFQRRGTIQDPPRVCRTKKPQVIPAIDGLEIFDIVSPLCTQQPPPPTTGKLRIELPGWPPGEFFFLEWHPQPGTWNPTSANNFTIVNWDTSLDATSPQAAWVQLTALDGTGLTFFFLLPGCR